MASLILLVLFSFLIAFFATENTATVNMTVAGATINAIPLYIVVLSSLLIGILISWIIHLASFFSHSATIHSKESELKNAGSKLKELENRNKELKTQINNMQKQIDINNKKAKQNLHNPSILDKLKASFG